MNSLLTKPHWAAFLLTPGLHSLPLPTLLAADSFFAWLAAGEPRHPSVKDYLTWAPIFDSVAPGPALDRLAHAFRVLLPTEVEQVLAAARAANHRPARTLRQTKIPSSAGDDWDPCAIGKRARNRQVSVHPSELPAPWQTALRRAASGFPGQDAGAPCRDILLRMLQKLCQFHRACCESGHSVEFSTQSITIFFDALEERLEARESGIRWATIRATAEELERFARYSGFIDEAAHRHLKTRLHRYAQKERGQDALKFIALFETGHTTASVLARACELVQEAAIKTRPSARHRFRTAAAILAMAAVLGLRNANSQLVLGRDLLWEADQWVLDTDIIKTRGRNGERLVVPLRPEFGAFIDITLLGDETASALPRIRAEVCAMRRPLIVRSDGQVPHPGYAARVFRLHTGNTLTSTRTMLHTDQAVRRGENGTRDTMAVLHQRSRRIAERYQGRAVRQAAIQRAQMGLSEKQAAALDDDQNAALAALRSTFGGSSS